MGTPAQRLVAVSGLVKQFPLERGAGHKLAALWQALRGRPTGAARTVLDDISLHVARGESVALIGANGAGKSTLLKILAGVLRPTSGQVTVNGRIAALLELGVGFEPRLSGMENLQLAAALLGIDQNELAGRLPAILDFADIGDHVHEPVRTYSSGMSMRLGFALATALEPDLLITDEVLAVGDESFQRKCGRWIDSYLATGGALLLVSHSMDQVNRLCERAYWLHDGRLRGAGAAGEVVDAYLAWNDARQSVDPDADYSGDLYRIAVLTLDKAALNTERRLVVTADIHSPDGRPPVVAFGLKDRHNTPVYGVTSEMDQAKPAALDAHHFRFSLELDLSALNAGHYRLTAHAMDPEALRLFDTVIRDLTLGGPQSTEGLLTLKVRN